MTTKPRSKWYDNKSEEQKQRDLLNRTRSRLKLKDAVRERTQMRLHDDIEFRWKQRFQRLQHRCKQSNIPCYNTFEEFWTDITPLPTHCQILGIELEYRHGEEYFKSLNYATMDKVVPEIGYVKGNVKIISNKANVLKQDHTIETLEKILQYITNATARRD